MFIVQVSYTIPTNDNKMTLINFFRARLTEATQEAGMEAFAKFIETCPYKNKDQAIYKDIFIEKKLK